MSVPGQDLECMYSNPNLPPTSGSWRYGCTTLVNFLKAINFHSCIFHRSKSHNHHIPLPAINTSICSWRKWYEEAMKQWYATCYLETTNCTIRRTRTTSQTLFQSLKDLPSIADLRKTRCSNSAYRVSKKAKKQCNKVLVVFWKGMYHACDIVRQLWICRSYDGLPEWNAVDQIQVVSPVGAHDLESDLIDSKETNLCV